MHRVMNETIKKYNLNNNAVFLYVSLNVLQNSEALLKSLYSSSSFKFVLTFLEDSSKIKNEFITKFSILIRFIIFMAETDSESILLIMQKLSS